MYRSEESQILFAAMSLGMQAQFATMATDDLRNLVARARRALPEDSATLQHLERELAAYEGIRRDPEALADWGRRLRDDALRLSRRPVDAHRRDIHG